MNLLGLDGPDDAAPVVVETGMRRALYVRGPLPWVWLTTCACLPGRALQVALALWFEAGLRKSHTVQLRPKHLRALGTDRHAVRRALLAMEGAGLVTVTRAPGRAHVVTILGGNLEGRP